MLLTIASILRGGGAGPAPDRGVQERGWEGGLAAESPGEVLGFKTRSARTSSLRHPRAHPPQETRAAGLRVLQGRRSSSPEQRGSGALPPEGLFLGPPLLILSWPGRRFPEQKLKAP